MTELLRERTSAISRRPARLGFLGVGWIGRHRMQAILETGCAQAVAIADTSPKMIADAAILVSDAVQVDSLDKLLCHDLDGVVIATPSAQHAAQSIKALSAGVAVFCQKPLGLTAPEVAAVVNVAKQADRLLGVDLSYRHTTGMCHIRDVIRSGELGDIFAADVVFHNAYGPDKAWFYDKALAGGGCLMDLGVHLVDMALWSFDFPEIADVSAHLMAGGQSVSADSPQTEDYAVATLKLENGAVLRLACSWRLQAGRDAVIEASFFGKSGGISMRNVNGSFYDFTTKRYYGTSEVTLNEAPEEWGGRAAADWARKLCAGMRYDPSCQHIINVAKTLDRIYQAAYP